MQEEVNLEMAEMMEQDAGSDAEQPTLDWSQTEQGEEDGSPAQSEEQAEQDQREDEQFSLPVKYNGQEIALDREQAVMFAQKGMNYDHVAQELAELREKNGRYGVIDEFAKAAGMRSEDYLDYLQQQRQKIEIRGYEQQGMPRDLARHIVGQRQETLGVRRELEQMRGELGRLQARQENARRWGAFFSAHPDVKSFDELPAEVRRAIAQGADPEAAYLRHENARVKSELSEHKQRRANALRAPGSARGEGSGDAMDAFARAFMDNLR